MLKKTKTALYLGAAYIDSLRETMKYFLKGSKKGLTFCHTISIIYLWEAGAMAKIGRPKSDNSKKKVLSVRVEDPIYEQICAYAQQHNMTVTEVVLESLERLFKKSKN